MIEMITAEEEIEDIVVNKSLIGNKVIAKNGEKIGIIKEIYVDNTNFCIKAIRIDKGPFSYPHIIGSEFIEKLGSNGVILNITPIEEYIGKEVIDDRGENIGKVEDIKKVESTNRLLQLRVSAGLGKNDYIIKPIDIKEIGEKILLKKPKDSFKKE